MSRSLLLSGATLIYLLGPSAFAATTYTVNMASDTVAGGGAGGGTTGELRFALNQILNSQAQTTSAQTWTVDITTPTITLNNLLPMINLFNPDQVTISSSAPGGTIINGNGFRPFFVRQGVVSLENLTVSGAIAKG